MKLYDVCGIGNGLVDILIQITEDEFTELSFERGSMNLVDSEAQAQLLVRFKDHQQSLVSGGSVANSIIAIAQLGGKGALATCLGDDRYGLFYESECEAFGIELSTPPLVGAPTGTCVSLITPDSERTMRTCLGVSATLSDAQVVEQTIAQSKWVFIEGYLFANPDHGHRAIEAGVQLAKKHGCKIALTLSDDWIVDLHPEFLRRVVAEADLIFANEREACALTKCSTVQEAFEKAITQYPNVVFTAGVDGAYLNLNGSKGHVPSFECKPKDLTGAGDIFAGSVLYGITHDAAPEVAVRAGNFLASKLIARIGARLHTGTREYWDESLALG